MIKKWFYAVVFILTSLLLGAQRYYGINGHPVSQDVYREFGIDNQLKLVKKHFNIYRIDLGLQSDGSVDNENLYKKLLEESKKNNVELLPILTFSDYFLNQTDSRLAGKNAALKFIEKYPFQYKMIEVSNEEDNQMILGNGTFTGENINHYNLSSENRSRLLFIKGICDALKENNIKTIINISYIHFGFLEILKKYNINYDIVGFHWYSDMGNIYEVADNKKNVINEIYRLTRKKILLTEFNVRNGLNSKTKNNWIKNNLTYISKNKNVLGIIWYELLDQRNMISEEQNYGFYEKESNGWSLKNNAQNILLKKY